MASMTRIRLSALAALAPAAFSAHAQTPATLEPMVVTATRSERAQLDVPASVDVLDRAEVRDTQWRVNLSESLALVPGVVALNRQNYAQDLQISIRGFGARSTFGVRGIRLYLDGIPATMPDGQGQVSHFPLSAVERIEVLRGPFSALYGNSSGGVIAMTTQLAPGPLEFEVATAAGAYGAWRAGVNGTGGTAPYAYAFDASRYSTEGYREHSAATRDIVNLRAAALDTPLGRIRLSLNAVDMPDAQDPLGLTRAQWQVDPRQASPQALQFNTRKSTRQSQLGTELSGVATGGLRYNAVAWTGSRSVTQFQAIPVGVQANSNHPGGIIDFDRNYGGVDARLQWSLGPVLLTLGASYERLDEDRLGYENFVTQPVTMLGVTGRLRRDENNIVDSTDVYAQAEADIAPRWRLLAGVRASRVEFRDSDHYLSNGDDSGSASFSAVNPTIGAVFRAGAATSLYASYGRGFETPTLNELAYRADGSAGFNSSLVPARSNNFEIGAKSVWSEALRGTIALFAVNTDDEIVVQSNSGGRSSFANASATRRRGAEASLGWNPLRELSLQLALTANHATYSEPFLICAAAPCLQPTLQVPAGNRLPGVPAYSAYLAASYRAPWAELKVEWRAQSGLPVDDRNTDAAAGYGVVNAALARTFDAGTLKIRAFLRIDNLLDARYIGSVIVNEANGRYFESAPGRAWLTGLDLRY
jgi:iron complex outermembrane receptor protein